MVSEQSTNKSLRVQPFPSSPENGVLPLAAGSGSEDGFNQVASGRLIHEERSANHMLLEVVPQLGSDEMPQDVVVVADGGYRYMDLGRQSGSSRPGGRFTNCSCSTRSHHSEFKSSRSGSA
jgi:hypothetical protein